MAQASSNSKMAVPPHIPRLSKPKRIATVVKSLQSIPREIVHQVLDDLPMLQVLLIASSESASTSTYIDECMLGHPKLQELFKSEEKLSAIRNLFIVLYSLRVSLCFKQAPDTSPLALNIRTFVTKRERMAPGHLQRYLRDEIYKILYAVPEDENYGSEQHKEYVLKPMKERLNALAEALKEPDEAKPKRYGIGDAQDCQVLRNRWQWMQAAQEKLNESRAAHLHKMADIYEAFPTLLKRSMDPTQQPRRNIQHITKQFHNYAKHLSKENWLTNPLYTKYRSVFVCNFLPLVPFDWCLRLFVRVQSVDKSAWPPQIVRDIDTVMAGMTYVYTTAMPFRKEAATDRKVVAPLVPRTRFTSNNVSSQAPDFSVNSSIDIPPWTTKELTNLMLQSGHWQPLDHNLAGIFPRALARFEVIKGKKRADFDKARMGPIPFAQASCSDECWEPSHEHPVFTMPSARHLGELFNHKKEQSAWPDWERLMPHHRKEVEWLEAFCRAVTYMKEMEVQQEQALSRFEGKCVIDDGQNLDGGAGNEKFRSLRLF